MLKLLLYILLGYGAWCILCALVFGVWLIWRIRKEEKKWNR